MSTLAVTLEGIAPATLTIELGTPGPQGIQGPAGPAGPAGPTFTGGPITSPITYTVGDTVSVFENGDFYVEHNGSGAYGVVYINGLEASDGTNTILVQASGITFGDLTVQNTAFPGFTGYALESWVTDGFYPLAGNPSGFLTASALTGYATESFVTSQGYIGDAPSDGSQYARKDGAWDVVSGGGGDFLPLAGGTMTGAIVFDGTSGQYISKGNFDTERGGNYGISLVCSIGYEFNWQAGWLTTTNQGSTTPRPLYLDSLAGTTLRSWDSATDTGTEVGHTGINVSNSSVYYVNVAPDLVKVFEATNELGVSIAHDSISIQHIDTPDRTSYFTNEYIGFEDISGTPHSAWIEHDVITVQDSADTTQMRSTGLTLSTGGSITFGDATTQTTSATNLGYISQGTADGLYYSISNPSGFTNNTFDGTSAIQAISGNSAMSVTAGPTSSGQYLKYNGSNLEWDTPGGGGVAWGSISGNLYDQTDLQGVLDSKYSTSNPSGFTNFSGSDAISAITGGYTSSISGGATISGQVLTYNGSQIYWNAGFSAPSSTNAVWAYGNWYNANVTGIYDGYMNYYTVLTF
jgi:hypothetical protein